MSAGEEQNGTRRQRPALRIEPPDGRPEIRIDVDLERMTDQAIAALSADPRVYQRGGSIVGVVTVPDGPAKLVRGVKRASGAQTIRNLESGTVRERMSSSARWLKFDGRSSTYVGALPPEAVVSAVMGRGEWGGFRPLVSVATSPQLRPDGTVLQTPGHDAATGLLYWPSDTFPGVADNPSVDDARGALSALLEVVADFPFASHEHATAWVAGLLTMLARAAVDGPVPLFAVDATTAGTGKSRLVDAAARIAYGHDAARTSMPDDDDEMRKRITAIVIEGDPCVCVDNIRGTVAMPSLEAVLTSVTWKDRVLGRTAQVSAPHRSTWWLTANNVVLGGDIARRTIHCRLESSLEKPEERPESDFAHPHLLAWIDQERRRLVACALTLLRAFAVAGRPHCGIRPWGSFESWSSLIPAAIVWAGGADPMAARATQNETIDEERQALRVVHDELLRLRGDEFSTVRTILSALYPERHPGEPVPKDGYEDLRDTLCAATRARDGRDPDNRRVGKYFERIRGKVLAGKRLVGGPQQNHVATWRVEAVQKAR